MNTSLSWIKMYVPDLDVTAQEYTDGVAEATNAENELFGTERMLEGLNSATYEDCKDLLQAVHKEIDGFVGDSPQFDDITMLSLRISDIDV